MSSSPTDLKEKVTWGTSSEILSKPLSSLPAMMFDGTLESLPGLKICAAHGGGYMPSYLDDLRWPARCGIMPTVRTRNTRAILEEPGLIDSIVFPKRVCGTWRGVGAGRSSSEQTSL